MSICLFWMGSIVTERRSDWMQTYTGRQYWPLDPRPEDVTAIDIAHHLSMLCRYCGACQRFYSVAEHSVGVLHVGTREAKRRGMLSVNLQRHLLLHDAPEAYCHDLIRPIKRCIDGYAEIEGLNYDAICKRFRLRGLKPDEAALIKQADNAVLLAEQKYVMGPAPAKWQPVEVPPEMVLDADAWMIEAPAQADPEYAMMDRMQYLGLLAA